MEQFQSAPEANNQLPIKTGIGKKSFIVITVILVAIGLGLGIRVQYFQNNLIEKGQKESVSVTVDALKVLSEQPKSYFDCSSSKECFAGYMKSCIPAKMYYDGFDFSYFGIPFTIKLVQTTMSYNPPFAVVNKVEGLIDDVCVFNQVMINLQDMEMFKSDLTPSNHFTGSEVISYMVPKNKLEDWENYLYDNYKDSYIKWDWVDGEGVDEELMIKASKFADGVKYAIENCNFKCPTNKIYSSPVVISPQKQGSSPLISNGNGWLPFDFNSCAINAIQAGEQDINWPVFIQLPFSILPYSNSGIFQFSCDPKTNKFEINVKLKSKNYSNGGVYDKESTDGGDNLNMYEIGSDLKIIN